MNSLDDVRRLLRLLLRSLEALFFLSSSMCVQPEPPPLLFGGDDLQS